MVQTEGFIDSCYPTLFYKLSMVLKKTVELGLTNLRLFFKTLVFEIHKLILLYSSWKQYRHMPCSWFMRIIFCFSGNNPIYLTNLMTQLDSIFSLKDLGSLYYFLCVQVTRTSSNMSLCCAWSNMFEIYYRRLRWMVLDLFHHRCILARSYFCLIVILMMSLLLTKVLWELCNTRHLLRQIYHILLVPWVNFFMLLLLISGKLVNIYIDTWKLLFIMA